MKGAYKKFNKKLYEQNDKIARQITKQLFMDKDGVELLDNYDQYGPDLLMKRNGQIICYVECEVKIVWNKFNFPYSTIQFPERKKKFTNLDIPTLFCMINNLKNRALTVGGGTLLSSPLVEVSNKYKSSGELFFQVPKDKVIFYDLRSDNA